MYIKVRVHAGVKWEYIEKIKEDTYEVAVKEEAKEGRANKRVLELLSQELSLPKSALRMISGHHFPSKIISVNKK
jgi:uncharacterized protein YggU (UPF0235/DUF167 family)